MGIYSKEEVLDMGEAAQGDYSAFTTNPETGEVLDAEVVEDDPVITQEKRQLLFKIAQSAFGKEEGNAILKKILDEVGIESTAGMRTSQHKQIVDRLMALQEEASLEQTNAGEEEAQADGGQQE